MKKIYSIRERLIYTLSMVLLGLLSLVLLINFGENAGIVIIALICVLFAVICYCKLTSISSHIIIENNRITFFHYPLLATNEFFVKKSSLILWNNVIHMDEVDKIELIELTKNEQKIYVGYKHFFNKFLRFNLKYGHSKYVYVGHYSNRQIRIIIKTLNDHKKTQT